MLRGEAFNAEMAKRLQKPAERMAVKKKQAKRQRFLSRRACRQIVYTRERMICQRCGKRTKLPNECYPGDPDMAHVNETTPRSKGGDPLNPDACELVCGGCHMPNGEHAPTKARMERLKALRKRKLA